MGEGCKAYGVYELTGYKNLREEPNLAVKIILVTEDVLLQALHARAKGIRRMCACWTRDKVRDFSLNTSNSTKTQNVDMSYQTFFFLPARLEILLFLST